MSTLVADRDAVLVADRDAVAANPAAALDVRVTARIAEATDVVLFELAATDGATLPPFSAGSHVDVEVAPGLTRQYSLCNHPEERHRYLVGVLKEPESRGGSVAMHARQIGDILRISSPRNHFPLVADAPDTLLLAGGIGVTPILCMAERLGHIDAPFTFHYCGRSKDRMAFRTRIESSTFALRAHLHFDDGPPEQRLDMVAAISALAPGGHLYVCGPPGFIAAALAAADTVGLPLAQRHREHFQPPEPVDTTPGGAFQVKIASSGEIIDIAADKTVAEALIAHGIGIETSCAQGVCGTCLTRVLEGVPDHRDYYLSEAEQKSNREFTPCCSRSLTPMLVLDL